MLPAESATLANPFGAAATLRIGPIQNVVPPGEIRMVDDSKWRGPFAGAEGEEGSPRGRFRGVDFTAMNKPRPIEAGPSDM
jgi:hypothetical protein